MLLIFLSEHQHKLHLIAVSDGADVPTAWTYIMLLLLYFFKGLEAPRFGQIRDRLLF